MTTADARVETFRANWIFILLLVLFGAAMLATAFDTFVVTCTIAFPLHDYDSSRSVRVFGWAFSTLCTGLFGWVLWMQAVAMAHYAARLDDRGVDFCFSSKKIPEIIISNRMRSRPYDTRRVDSTYYVVANDNFSVKFTRYIFFQPKKLALRIATPVGQTIEEDKP